VAPHGDIGVEIQYSEPSELTGGQTPALFLAKPALGFVLIDQLIIFVMHVLE
jgi:hypothetical protein